jgi:DNA modification methylase
VSTQSKLNLTSKSSGPVECLGQTFASDDVRREHYLKLLAEKLKDPEFRKIEGFPIGEDEDILALSDPPYYTACPNPWICDFIKQYGRPYDPKEKYHRKPLETDLVESRNNAFVNAHSYATKTPHQSIMSLITHYTEPGDIVLDFFGGTGMTGVAAQLCENPNTEFRDSIQKNNSNVKWGARMAIVGDLGPAATFISRNFNIGDDWDNFESEVNQLKLAVEREMGWMFKTQHVNGDSVDITCVIWSDFFTCPDCAQELNYWEQAVDLELGRIENVITCKNCGAKNSKTKLGKAWVTLFDKTLKKSVRQIKSKPVIIVYDYAGKRYEKIPDEQDMALIARVDSMEILDWFPEMEVPQGFNTEQPKRSHGLTHLHHFFTRRNLIALASAWKHAKSLRVKFMLTSLMYKSSVFCAPLMSNFFASRNGEARGGWVGKERSGTLYCPSIHSEVMLLPQIASRSKSVRVCADSRSLPLISTQSACNIKLPDDCIDYIFTDPPFGANRMYSELNFLWEAWLGVVTAIDQEAIENPARNKTQKDYKRLMLCVFKEYFRILKPGRWISVQFSNTQASVWNTLQAVIAESGFVVVGVANLHKQQGSIEAYTSSTAVKQDLVISAYKPNGGLEDRFSQIGHTAEGVWEFLRTHLNNLPVVKPRGGDLEYIAERDPRILYDRMVAFYVVHGVPVPLSSAEFQRELAEKFPEREGMFFLPEQVTEWDKKRSQMQGVGQMSIFVEDEKSAIDWLRNYLKGRPSTYQDIQPEFMQQLGASWKKFETRPELSLLLEQNFLKYDGKGEVPSQVHSYLSTQFKDLRNLPKDSVQLQVKAKDRWYVPDPAKAVDVEAVRNKRLLQEFWDLCSEAGISRPTGPSAQRILPLVTQTSAKKIGRKKIKEVRTEAVRLGFKECFATKDYSTILAIAEHLPANVIEEDEQLQMMHDMAEMRAQS